MTTRETLHQLVDELPERSLDVVARSLATLRDDPVLFALLIAPEDDEPVTEEEARALDDALEAWRAGSVHSTDEVSRLLRS